jgi:hypothetical protein
MDRRLGRRFIMTVHNKPSSDDAITAVCNERMAGLQQFTKGVGTINVKGTPYKPAALVAIYQKCIDTRTQLAAIRAQEPAALEARDAADATRKSVDASVLAWAVETYGPNSPQAKTFGYVAPNPAKPTAQTRAAAVAKSKATREARGTAGKKQKKKITGTPSSPPPAAK